MKKLILITLALAVAGCASTEFKAYESKQNVHEGTGGTRASVEGIDIWSNGTPPRKYKVLGIIEDERGGDGFSRQMRQSAIVNKAREIGADAVIEGDYSEQSTGFVSTGQAFSTGGSAFGTGFAVPTRRMFSKYVAIKYLD